MNKILLLLGLILSSPAAFAQYSPSPYTPLRTNVTPIRGYGTYGSFSGVDVETTGPAGTIHNERFNLYAPDGEYDGCLSTNSYSPTIEGDSDADF
jgi:hypothetical protein